MTGKTKRLRDAGGDHRRAIADDEDGVNRPPASRIDNRVYRARLVMEANRNRVVLPRVFEHVAAIGREHELDAQTLGRLTKRARLITRCRREQQHPWHESPNQHPSTSPQPPAPSTKPERPALDSAPFNST